VALDSLGGEHGLAVGPGPVIEAVPPGMVPDRDGGWAPDRARQGSEAGAWRLGKPSMDQKFWPEQVLVLVL
jgi:hypothetical protein